MQIIPFYLPRGNHTPGSCCNRLPTRSVLCSHRGPTCTQWPRGPAGGRARSCALSLCMTSKSFFYFSPCEKAALRFQCILKSILHVKTVSELHTGHYTLLCACTGQLICK